MNALPQDEQGVIALILSQYDHAGLEQAICTAERAHQEAQQRLASAQLALRAHEASAPGDDPTGWAKRLRELSDALPVFERLATEARGQYLLSLGAIGTHQLRAIERLKAQAQRDFTVAAELGQQRVEELRAAIHNYQGGRYPEFQRAAAVITAIDLAKYKLDTERRARMIGAAGGNNGAQRI